MSNGNTVSLSYVSDSAGVATLKTGTEYTVAMTTDGHAAVTLTSAGLAKVAGRPVSFFYTPAADEYGDVTVQAGALIASPTNADHVGGRIALVGSNVTNAATLSAPNGQVILAAGLQIGFAAHSQNDPSLRGLDVYVGKVTDPSAATTTW